MSDDRQHAAGWVSHDFENIISVENLLAAWQEFVRGKRNKKDVQEFQYRLMDNILELHEVLKKGEYRHGGYYAFKISDPKPRDIHKATVADRLIHHALYRRLYPYFDRTWISDSYSCRNDKGTHRAMERFKSFAYKVSRNHTRTGWVLKCDIKKFFASIDQEILVETVSRYVKDHRTLSLVRGIVESFSSTGPGKGLPLGNLTSQMLVNVYMNRFDQFVKHRLKARRYIRYADDFVILSEDRSELEALVPIIRNFLMVELKLTIHPNKLFIKTLASGVDFLGWVHFPTHRVIRTASKKRMLRNLAIDRNDARLESYRGLLSHGNAHALSTKHLQDRTPSSIMSS